MPNFLTTIRVLTPFYFLIILLFLGDVYLQRILLFLVFMFLSITDFLDGYIARKLNIVSNYGKVFDPISDKILVSTSLIYLISEYNLLLYPSLLIIFREFLVSGVREYSLISKKKSVDVTNLSKIKTITQFLSICGLFADLLIKKNLGYNLFNIFYTLLWISTLLTLFTGYNYCYKIYRN